MTTVNLLDLIQSQLTHNMISVILTQNSCALRPGIHPAIPLLAEVNHHPPSP